MATTVSTAHCSGTKVEREKKAFVDCAKAKVTEILKRATPPLDNLTLGERKAIHCKRTSELR